MKTPHTPTPLGCFFLGLSLLLGLSPATARADITGQWNFTDGLSAEIGQDLEWNFDQGEAQFGKGSAFRLKPLDGKDPSHLASACARRPPAAFASASDRDFNVRRCSAAAPAALPSF